MEDRCDLGEGLVSIPRSDSKIVGEKKVSAEFDTQKQVEGLEEFLNQSKSGPQQSPEKTMDGSLSIPRSARRTSTRRKPIQVESESSQPLTQSRPAMDQEKTDVPKTLAAPNT
ncbi:muscle M-line assembly protein unc-89 [Prunus yedoensis var. nudiflora]|uniref:Muscle M-line assembly protein unc-89 n=1 Tax=Prunus yedoensis var. nudiflora TaxID=2094558 RepID=A0A314YYK4_PRUYE|nr:muscle M-line assembly protein unc-89 [Prunus yedoensis var. nudiflora]